MKKQGKEELRKKEEPGNRIIKEGNEEARKGRTKEEKRTRNRIIKERYEASKGRTKEEKRTRNRIIKEKMMKQGKEELRKKKEPGTE
jgi:hypothetical protein